MGCGGGRSGKEEAGLGFGDGASEFSGGF
jgi:hypothetical protein